MRMKITRIKWWSWQKTSSNWKQNKNQMMTIRIKITRIKWWSWQNHFQVWNRKQESNDDNETMRMKITRIKWWSWQKHLQTEKRTRIKWWQWGSNLWHNYNTKWWKDCFPSLASLLRSVDNINSKKNRSKPMKNKYSKYTSSETAKAKLTSQLK